MKIECKDFERALEVPELLPDAREHARDCPACRRELWVWGEISNVASELREEWDSPELWPKIQRSLAAEPKTRRSRGRWLDWKTMGAIAAVVAIAATAAIWYQLRNMGAQGKSDSAFLTEQALKEVEQAESAYAKSIEKLSRVAEPMLQHAETSLASAYREKLLLLDSAISELKANINQNRFNASLQAELAALYKQKQETLQEILHREQKN